MFKQYNWKKETKSFINTFIVFIIIRTFFLQPFTIPSGSMYPNLMVGDFLVASKPYGLTPYSLSLPWVHKFFSGRHWGRNPERGEIVLFTNPKNTALDYIKRCIGLPGDRIQMIDGVLHINSQPVKLKKIEDYHMVDYRTDQFKVMAQYVETFPNGHEHTIILDYPMGEHPLDNTTEFVVPQGCYFMMGDNRHHSIDSRVQEEVGFVPQQFIIGKAQLLFFSTEAKWYQPHLWLFSIRPTRIGKWLI